MKMVPCWARLRRDVGARNLDFKPNLALGEVLKFASKSLGNVEVTSSILVSSFFIGNNVFQIDAEWASVFFYVERDVELTRSF